MPAYDIITIGSSLVDIFVRSNELHLRESERGTLLCETYGEKIEVEQFSVHAGGGGSNTAVGFARQGFRTAVVSEMGQDAWSQIVIKDFEREMVSPELLIREKLEQTGGTVALISPEGGRTLMVYRGAASQLNAYDIPVNHLLEAKWVHLSSIGGQLEAILKIFSAMDRNSRLLSWNPGKREIELLLQERLPVSEISAQILLVNQEEWESLAPLQERLTYRVPKIVITNGRAGGRVVVEGQVAETYHPEPAEAVEETGAGDAFAVGFVTGHLLGKTVRQSVEYGKVNAASVVRFPGAKQGLLSRAHLEKIVTEL